MKSDNSISFFQNKIVNKKKLELLISEIFSWWLNFLIIICVMRLWKNIDIGGSEFTSDIILYSFFQFRLTPSKDPGSESEIENSCNKEHDAASEEIGFYIKAGYVTMEIDDSELVEDSEPGIDGVAFSGDDKLSKLSDFEEGSDDRDNEYINRAPGVENFCYGEEMSLQFEFHGDHPE